MRVLLLGATGNLGLRLVPALIVHGHTVTAYVRSENKLRSLLPDELTESISIYEGDALDSPAVEDALRKHNCDAVMNTAGNRVAGKEQLLGKIAASVSSAAIRVGRDRGKPLRAWFIGGLTSLHYPGTNYQIQDYLFEWMSRHHKETEQVIRAIPTIELQWTLLCVAFMTSEWKEIAMLQAPKQHNLILQTWSPPEWQDSWLRYVPFIGLYLNMFVNISPYTTRLENVADMIAEDFAKTENSEFVGALVGMKESSQKKVL